jgi:hypothetical protein
MLTLKRILHFEKCDVKATENIKSPMACTQLDMPPSKNAG